MSNPPLTALTQQQLTPLFDDLRQQGLVLATVVNVQQLSTNVWLDSGDVESRKKGCLLLLGHGGRLFWQRYQQTEPEAVDPVDTFSSRISAQALQQHLPSITREQLFPAANCPANLMALGREIGWHTPSPLGMGINAQYGLWSAYRALWWLDAELEEPAASAFNTMRGPDNNVLPVAADICSQCTTQNCLQACPATALSMDNIPNLQQCADFRLAANSSCSNTCLARMACPVAAEHRYTTEQMTYHYDLARSQIHLFSSQARQENSQQDKPAT